jgi:hypothetical protein
MRKGFLIVLVIACMSACGKKADDGPVVVVPPPSESGDSPTLATLVFPAENAACTTGTVSGTKSTITLIWSAPVKGDSYDIGIKDLLTGIINTYSSTKASLDVSLPINTPYSWYVISKLTGSTKTAQSSTRKFYLSGPGVTSYAPFPAEIVTPTLGQALASTTKVTLDWAGSDVDNNISTYDVYFGTSSTPPLLKGGQVESILNDVVITPNTTYYWEVITRDALGYTSDSGLYQFKVN